MAETYGFNVLITGNSSVGKSSIVNRFVNGVFSEVYNGTNGLDYKSKRVEHAGKTINLRITDTGGQDKMMTLTNTYYKRAQGILFVYDVTDQESFINVKDWIREADSYNGGNVCKIIVGNKTDLSEERVIDADSAKAFAADQNSDYMEVSAKTGQNVDELFRTMIGQLIETRETTQTTVQGPRRAGGCCTIA